MRRLYGYAHDVFVAAAVCPHPPLLVPEVAGRAAPELDDLRTACTTAVTAMLEADPDAVVCVGDGPRLGRYDESDGGTLAPYGVDVRAGGSGSSDLPLALTIGAWLLDRAAWTGPRRYFALPQETTGPDCGQMGEKVSAADLRVGVLAMGDGSARRSTSAPGYLDDRAEPFDAEVARALSEPDLRWLADALPPVACAELWVAGRTAWQFLAGAATQTPQDTGPDTEPTTGLITGLTARMHYDAAPYGVGYLVADWTT
jgi:hypothetical protein